MNKIQRCIQFCFDTVDVNVDDEDDIDVTDEENLIIDLVGGDREDEGDYRTIEVVYAKSIGIKHAEFLQECFIAFPFGGKEWLRQLAIKERRDR